jgi:hypothetical protein
VFFVVDNDPIVTVTPQLGQSVEGNSGTSTVRVPLVLSSASGHVVKVNWQTLAYEANEADFVAASGTVSFAPGTTTAEVLVTVRGDTVPEPNELVIVPLSAPQNARLGGIGPGLGFGRILNDD